MKCEKVIRFSDKNKEKEAICKPISEQNLELRSKFIIFAKQKKEAIGLLFSFLERIDPTKAYNGLGFSR